MPYDNLPTLQETNPLLPKEMMEHLKSGIGSEGQVFCCFIPFEYHINAMTFEIRFPGHDITIWNTYLVLVISAILLFFRLFMWSKSMHGKQTTWRFPVNSQKARLLHLNPLGLLDCTAIRYGWSLLGFTMSIS